VLPIVALPHALLLLKKPDDAVIGARNIVVSRTPHHWTRRTATARPYRS